ncbi:unnamed protein product [Kluyveromyces dobzhanskii CBS 2104]|uniref:WGS project CCBQ000000000 data, contig 00099 n=1 Tax=Kluyveromyces dobzhanskii CBS 2104 TaxID=1427455 RepID=A0A0A8L309_9SACH|nr:unnamed protein product [Kluyveromyces dobzhanskii CBS 2104]
MKTTLLFYSTVSFVLATVSASVYEAYPVNKQLPKIARVDERFEFQISNDTLKSSNQGSVQLSYAAYNLPDWLSFDSDSLTFSGTVTSDFLEDNEDTKYFDVILQGTDPTDSVSFNATCELVATKKSGISIADDFNLLNLLKNYGNTNGKDGLKLSPADIFNVTFEWDSFEASDNDSAVTYYGRSSQYNAPLPSWMFFDANNLKFSGSAPVVNSEIAPEMDYAFNLIATDIDGYAGASIEFQIIVGANRLTTTIENTLVINVTDSRSFSYPVPLDYVFLNDEVISTDDLGDINLVDTPDWISITSNYTLQGNLPANDSEYAFQLSIYDKYMDVVYLNFVIESTQNLFAISSFPSVNVTKGEYMKYSLLPSQFTSSDETTVSANFSSQDNWLHFQSSNLTFYGEVPDDFSDLSIDIIASDGSKSDSLSLKMIGIDSKNSTTTHTSSSASHSSTSTSTSSPSSSATSSSAALVPNNKKSKSTNIVAIVCGVMIPVVVLLILLIAFIFWRRKRNQKKEADNEKMAISGPDPKNPANDPNGGGYANPFTDEHTLGSDEVSTEAKRLATLNAMKLDDISNSSTMTSLNEKVSEESFYQDAEMANSKDMLIHRDDESSVFDDKYRSSSIYFQNAPSQRKSWRYSKNKTQPDDRTMRQSYASLNTVSTQELLSSELKTGSSLPHDPRKSSLGLRDSVFWSKDTSNSSPLKTVSENVVPGSTTNETQSPHSSMSSDGLIPLKQQDGQYKWVTNEVPIRKKSSKRIGSVREQAGVNVSNVNHLAGESPERM